jgi:hypothetical protein
MPRYFLQLILVAIIIAGASFFYYQAFANDSEMIEQQKIDFGGRNGTLDVRLIISPGEKRIEIKKNFYSNCSKELIGFQDEAKIKSVVKIGKDIQAVEISGSAGVHAENKQFFILDTNYCPLPIGFVKDSEISYNIYSDEPYFLVQDINTDSYIDLAVDYRNYDLDPIVNAKREIYIFDFERNRFVFNRLEFIKYEIN